MGNECGGNNKPHQYVTDDGDVIGITKFGESATGDEVMKEYGFSTHNIKQEICRSTFPEVTSINAVLVLLPLLIHNL